MILPASAGKSFRTKHNRLTEVVELVLANPVLYAVFKFFPWIPYANKYANLVAEMGMIGVLRHFLPVGILLAASFAKSKVLASKYVEGIGRLLIDAEIRMFSGVSAPVIFIKTWQSI